MDALSFGEFVRLLGSGATVSGDRPAAKVGNVSIDSRTLVAGDCFFAIKGERFDGHDYLWGAAEAGAIALVVRRDWRSGPGIEFSGAIIRVEDPLAALQEMARGYRNRFSLPVIGLTGSNGKTTTKEMIGCVLETEYRLARTPGNLNNHIGTPLSVLQIDSETEIAIIEMGMNHIGEIADLCSISLPNHGLITNIGRGHIGFFESIKDVAAAKSELFRSLQPDDTAFINSDDPWIVEISKNMQNKITYGLQSGLDLSGEILDCDPRGCFSVRLQDSHDVQLRVPGRHHVHNAIASAAVGNHFGVPIADIVESLESFTGIAKRLELIHAHGALMVMDAYNSNPESLEAALETSSYLAEKQEVGFIAVLGDMLELGKHSSELHNKAGQSAARHGVERLFLFGPESVNMEKGFKTGGGRWVKHFKTKKALVRSLRSEIRTGDIVLIKGSRGIKMEEILNELQNQDSENANS